MTVIAGLGSGVVGAAVSVVVGIVALYVGAEALVEGASGLTDTLGVSAALAGVTVIAFATTAPELSVVLLAAAGNTDAGTTLGLGTIVGSNVANIGLVLGVSALLRPLEVSRDTVRYHLPFVALAAVGLVWLAQDAWLGRREGAMLLGGLVVFTLVLYRTTTGENEPEVAADGGHVEQSIEPRDAAYVVVGLVGLVIGARQLVAGGETVMVAVGVSERIVGLTVVALGTSLPELAASVVAAVRGQDAFSVGNVVGSNVYNVLAVVGVMLLVTPTFVSRAMIDVDFPFLLGMTGLLAALLVVRGRIGRPGGIVLLAGYAGYVVFGL